MYSLSKSLAAAGARRRRGGGLVAAALVTRPVTGRLARAGHQLPVDDRVRLAPAFEARAADRRVDGVGGRLLGVVEPDVALLALRVFVFRLPPSPSLVP